MKLSFSDASRVLQRTTFGPTIENIEELQFIGLDAWLTNQFRLDSSSHYDRYRYIQSYRENISGNRQEHINYRINAWWDLIVNCEDQLRQRVAFALSQLLVVSEKEAGLDENDHAAGLAKYYDILVNNAFGSYRDILYSISKSSVMGIYLTIDGNLPASGDDLPDQNYAREIMQLFTLGDWKVNLDGSLIFDGDGKPISSHSQEDIEELARVFTGWKVKDKYRIEDMINVEGDHDEGEKFWLGESIPAGQTAEQELSFVVDKLVSLDETAVLVSRHLIRQLVSSNPSSEYVYRVSSAFRSSKGDLGEVVKAIITDSEFLNTSKSKRKAKEPILAFSSVCRALDAKMGKGYPHHKDTSIGFGYRSQYSKSGPFMQGPLTAPSVFNFYSFDYQPLGPLADNNLIGPEFEIMTAADLASICNLMSYKLKDHLIVDGTDVSSRSDKWLWLQASELAALFNAENKAQFIDELNKRFFNFDASPKTLNYISSMFDAFVSNKENLWKVIWMTVMSPEYYVQG
ncbi:DUF1800 domain-containing protein [Vibrio maritimus]|uniref:DUF1800 domain-containing protein n=1 Tax=Vibrio maritimus TaxID=990268 RepID=UPI001F451FF3|nr:DUF1800 family protein [Vibrio maritimus]